MNESQIKFDPCLRDNYRLLIKKGNKAIGHINRIVGATERMPKAATICLLYGDCLSIREWEEILNEAKKFAGEQDGEASS